MFIGKSNLTGPPNAKDIVKSGYDAWDGQTWKQFW